MSFTFGEAMAFLDGLPNFETLRNPENSEETFTLDRITALLAELGNPQCRYPSIHVTGTKGKGSTAAMIAGILTASGRKVGFYSSPHLHSPRERIAIDRAGIASSEFARVAQEIEQGMKDSGEVKITCFEAMTAMAFRFFALREVGFAVVEVGMGGRLDATNVLEPAVSVITPVSLDHTAILGKTTREIAIQKAGIIKKGGFLVSAPQTPDVAKVLEDRCREMGARMVFVERCWEAEDSDLHNQGFSYGPFRHCRLPLLGEHQLENACTALQAITALKSLGFSIPDEAVRNGLETVKWPGRFQILSQNPFLVVDGAQNRSSAAALRTGLSKHFGNRKRVVIIGTSCDKDVAGIVEELLPGTDLFIATRSRHPRGAAPGSIVRIIKGSGSSWRETSDLPAALDLAKSLVPADGVICVTGSLFLVGEAIRAFSGTPEE